MMTQDALDAPLAEDEAAPLNLLLQKLLTLFSQSPYLSHVSLQRPRGDSIFDSVTRLVIGYRSEAFGAAVECLAPLIQLNFNVLFPALLLDYDEQGGGLCFLYLFIENQTLCPLNLCLTPVDASARHIKASTEALLYVSRACETDRPLQSPDAVDCIKKYDSEARNPQSYLIEALILTLLLQKRKRFRLHAGHAEIDLLGQAIWNLLSAAADSRLPASARFDMQGSLMGAMSRQLNGAGSVEPHLHRKSADGQESFDALVLAIRDLARQVMPDGFETFEDSINYCYRYLHTV